ncbi:hypothetical protein [Deinococcus sp. JMULE3]|uniref:hypothetical protein n=1 Tax=Deinococcus sp. JMULE3 TaxID=2518341 RepID=UPI001576F2BC|nr:hypothetical protein [Deinococcus sp. JMULE3]NTX99311.1 hypothetical protein [Deinococcus sp. JMULE3]
MISPDHIADELNRRAPAAHAATIPTSLMLDVLRQLGCPDPDAGLRRALQDLARPAARGLRA